LVKDLPVGAVIGDSRGWILELMASQDANDPVAGGDDPFAAEFLGAGDAGRGGRLTAQATPANLGLGIENLLVRNFPNGAAATLEGAQRVVQVHRMVDFDCAGDSGGAYLFHLKALKIALDDALAGLAAIPAQA